ARREVRLRQFVDRRNERFGHEPSAERPEVAAGVRIAVAEPRFGPRLGLTHSSLRAASTAAKNSRSRAALLMPGASSTPDDTSTPQGRTAARAAATLVASSTPASSIGRRADN